MARRARRLCPSSPHGTSSSSRSARLGESTLVVHASLTHAAGITNRPLPVSHSCSCDRAVTPICVPLLLPHLSAFAATATSAPPRCVLHQTRIWHCNSALRGSSSSFACMLISRPVLAYWRCLAWPSSPRCSSPPASSSAPPSSSASWPSRSGPTPCWTSPATCGRARAATSPTRRGDTWW